MDQANGTQRKYDCRENGSYLLSFTAMPDTRNSDRKGRRIAGGEHYSDRLVMVSSVMRQVITNSSTFLAFQ